MPDPDLPLLEDAVRKLAPFLDEIVFVGGVTLGLLITDKAAPHSARPYWDTTAPRGSLPFRVFAEYARASTCHTAADAVLANAQRIWPEGKKTELEGRLCRNSAAPKKCRPKNLIKSKQALESTS